MRNKIIIWVFILSFSLSCVNKDQEKKEFQSNEAAPLEANNNKNSDVFFHYSIWWAFVNKVFEGELTSAELKLKGDMGLGSFNLLDGELIMLNGILYQAKETGEVLKPQDSSKIVYANAAFFDKDGAFDILEAANYDSLRTLINSKLPSKNYFYAFKIHGDFINMKCGGLHKQERPFENGLDVLIPSRPIFERSNFKGTMVGFYCPEFIGNINVSGFHLHFVSDDEKFAGHVMEFKAENLKVEYDQMNEYQFVLPKTKDYENVGFEKQFQYQKK